MTNDAPNRGVLGVDAAACYACNCIGADIALLRPSLVLAGALLVIVLIRLRLHYGNVTAD